MRKEIKGKVVVTVDFRTVTEIELLDKFGRIIKCRSCIDKADVERVFELFCRDAWDMQ